MRLKVAESVVVGPPAPDLHFHNVSKGECNRNTQDNLTEFEELNRTQWASNFLTSQNTDLLSNGSNVNNNFESTLQQQQQQQQQNVRRPSFDTSYDLLSESSPDDSLGDVDGDAPQSSSSLDVSPQGDDSQSLSHDDLSDSDSLSDDTNCTSDFTFTRGIVNPNYPGFQHLAHHLHRLDTDADDERQEHNNNDDDNNNNDDDEEVVGESHTLTDNVNHLGRVESTEKAFYDIPKISIADDLDDLGNYATVVSITDLVNDLNVHLAEEAEQSELVNDVNVGLGACSLDESLETKVEEEFINEETCEIVAEKQNPVTDSLNEETYIADRQIEEEDNRVLSELSYETTTESEVISENFCEKKEETSGAMFLDEEAFDPVGASAENIKTDFLEESSCKTADHELPLTYEGFMKKIVKTDLAGNELKTVAEQEMKRVKSECVSMEESSMLGGVKMDDAFLLKAIHEDLPGIDEASKTSDLLHDFAALNRHEDSNRDSDEREKFTKEEQTANEKEKDEDSVTPRKKEKMDMNYSMKKNRHSIFGDGMTSEMQPTLNLTGGVVRRREFGPRGRESMMSNRRSMPPNYEKKRSTSEILGGFDVYNIETAMPKIDLDAIESHLRVAREEDRRRRNDREEIRKRLAMGSDADEYYGGDRPGRKPSLQARLQSGMNLQICFMNETASDAESPGSDAELLTSPEQVNVSVTNPQRIRDLPAKSPSGSAVPGWSRPSASKLTLQLRREPDLLQTMTEADFFARQARLQAEAHMALAQAKEMAHMQMEIERQRQKKSPITEMVRTSLEKVGIPFPEDRRRVSRQILTEMNLAQLQVIVNDLHTQIEVLNEGLVKFLMNRDDLHMEQDSMLVDIEDLTRYLGAKEQSGKAGDPTKDPPSPTQDNLILLTNKPKLGREAGIVRK